MIKNILIVLLVLFLVGSAVWHFTDYVNEKTPETVETVSQDELPVEETVENARQQVPDVVAMVNGVEISKEEFFRVGEQVARDAAVQGFDINSQQAQAEISQIAMANLIDQLLLLELAQNADITVSDEWVDEQYELLVESAGGPESFQAQLEQNNVDPAVIKNDFKNQSMIELFLEQELELDSIVITDDQISEYYSQLSEQNGTSTPSLDEISEQISEQLLAQERQGLIGEYLSTIRVDAEIDVKI